MVVLKGWTGSTISRTTLLEAHAFVAIALTAATGALHDPSSSAAGGVSNAIQLSASSP